MTPEIVSALESVSARLGSELQEGAPEAAAVAKKMYKHILQAQDLAQQLNKHLKSLGVYGKKGAVGGSDIGSRLYNIQQDLLALSAMK